MKLIDLQTTVEKVDLISKMVNRVLDYEREAEKIRLSLRGSSGKLSRVLDRLRDFEHEQKVAELYYPNVPTNEARFELILRKCYYEEIADYERIRFLRELPLDSLKHFPTLTKKCLLNLYKRGGEFDDFVYILLTPKEDEAIDFYVRLEEMNSSEYFRIPDTSTFWREMEQLVRRAIQ